MSRTSKGSISTTTRGITEWTISAAPSSDDWGEEADPACGLNSPTTTRLTAAQQYQVDVSYIAGFFRLVMGHENAFAPMFGDSA